MYRSDLGRELLKARSRAGLTRKKLGAASGLSPDAIYLIESGQTRKPHLRNIYRLCRVLQLDPDTLIADEAEAV